MRMLSQPALQVPRCINRHFVSVDDALVREEASPRDCPKLIVLCVPITEEAVSGTVALEGIDRSPRIPNAILTRRLEQFNGKRSSQSSAPEAVEASRSIYSAREALIAAKFTVRRLARSTLRPALGKHGTTAIGT